MTEFTFSIPIAFAALLTTVFASCAIADEGARPASAMTVTTVTNVRLIPFLHRKPPTHVFAVVYIGGRLSSIRFARNACRVVRAPGAFVDARLDTNALGASVDPAPIMRAR